MLRPKDPRLFCSAPVLFFIVAAVSCGPTNPSTEPGTPAFYWKAAGDTFASGDYDKTNRNLGELVRKQGEFTARAQPWLLILTAGVGRGYAELADNFEYGARSNKINPGPFRAKVGTYRQMAGQAALQFAETFQEFEKRDQTQPVPLDFPYPSGSSMKVPELAQVANGVLVSDALLPSIEKRAIQRGVLNAVFEAAGAPEDAGKTQALFKAGNVQVPADLFAMAMAKNLYGLARLFERQKLDMPQRVEILCNQGQNALRTVKESKESKKLSADFDKLLKSAKTR
jgi:hypothetical protein